MKTFADFIDLACTETGLPTEDARRVLSLHLKQNNITEWHVELYINYPEYTEAELAEHFGMTRAAVQRALQTVRRVWPSLQSDPKMYGGCDPGLQNMKRIEFDSERLADDGSVIRF